MGVIALGHSCSSADLLASRIGGVVKPGAPLPIDGKAGGLPIDGDIEPPLFPCVCQLAFDYPYRVLGFRLMLGLGFAKIFEGERKIPLHATPLRDVVLS
jgi:hypothetical protein